MSGKKSDTWLIAQGVIVVFLLVGFVGRDKLLSIFKMLLSKSWEPLWNYFGRDIVIGYSIYFGIVLLLFFLGILLTKKTRKKIYLYISGILNLIGLVGMYIAYK